MGFQMFCSYGHAYRLTKENYYKDILLKSADELAKLYNPRVGTLFIMALESERKQLAS